MALASENMSGPRRAGRAALAFAAALLATATAIEIALVVPLALPLAGAAAEAGVSARDPTGKLVSLPRPALKIAALAPGAVELLFEIGKGGAIAVRGADCDRPIGALALPVSSANFDAKGFDLVIVESPEATLSARAPRERTFIYAPRDFRQLAEATMALGVLTGAEKDGIRAAAAMTGAVSRVKAIVGRMRSNDFPHVFWMANAEPLATRGAGSFVPALVAEAGGRNLFKDLGGLEPRLSPAQVAARDPQVIVIENSSASIPGSPAEDSILRALARTTAVSTGRIVRVDASKAESPGPRSPGLLLELARAFHPGVIP
jgi:iron complex transport system substrate-binding protein